MSGVWFKQKWNPREHKQPASQLKSVTVVFRRLGKESRLISAGDKFIVLAVLSCRLFGLSPEEWQR